jgi:hypothetical protein
VETHHEGLVLWLAETKELKEEEEDEGEDEEDEEEGEPRKRGGGGGGRRRRRRRRTWPKNWANFHQRGEKTKTRFHYPGIPISEPDFGFGVDPGRALRGCPLAHLAGTWR